MKKAGKFLKNEGKKEMTQKQIKKAERELKRKEERLEKDLQDAGILQILKRHMFNVKETTDEILERYAFPENYSSTSIRNTCKIALWRLIHGEIGL